MKKHLLSVLSASLLAGCANLAPEPFSSEEIKARVVRDRQEMYRDQAPILKPITFHDAVARALTYNLDYRLKLMESALSRGISDSSAFDLLPRLTASAGYTWRNNDSGGTSVSIITGEETLSPSTSQERQLRLYSAELSWNILDFGLSYYRAKQAGDEVNIAEERRRKVQQNIVQDMRNSYWRALGAQRLLVQVAQLTRRIEHALEQSRQAEASGVLPPAQALAYQRALLDALTLITLKRQELEFARHELAALMNIPPDTTFELADAPEDALPPVPVQLAELETRALESRPELREEDYRARIDGFEARRQLIALLPGIEFLGGSLYDSNKYLYNNSWYNGSVQISWNVLKLAAYPTVKRTQEAREQTAEARRLALSMAVITQVRVAIERYKLALLDYRQTDESARVDQRLAQISQAGVSSRVESELEAVRTESRALVTQFQRYAAYANAQTALGRILNSVGLNVLPDELETRDLAAVADELQRSLDAGERDVFQFVSAEAPKPQSLRIEILSLPAGISKPLIVDAVSERLRGNRLLVTSDTAASAVFTMKLNRGPVKNGVERSEWLMTLRDPSGKLLATRNYSTVLTPDLPQRSLQAFAEAAALSQVSLLREQLAPTTVPATTAAAR
ncbi:MAG: TolC family protein [Rhodobacteraceae bacterium]|uniref:TolC family protein n=1 Tax=Accumulibacter sp. TaxID=2053492 RepID=UPI0019EC9AF9|nr:TolC family protein [Accumulibacter sp.]MBE2257846.1 TolC family protein [Paracoccaceae bacterium]MCB1941816.1 TolC family protein [Accumulibacter sp.]